VNWYWSQIERRKIGALLSLPKNFFTVISAKYTMEQYFGIPQLFVIHTDFPECGCSTDVIFMNTPESALRKKQLYIISKFYFYPCEHLSLYDHS
jgi:hypothetical protein